MNTPGESREHDPRTNPAESMDESLAAVRRADPAAEVTADLPGLRAMIEARRSQAEIAGLAPVQTPAPDDSVAHGEGATVTALHSRRRRGPWLVAAAAAVALFAGAGGYQVGATQPSPQGGGTESSSPGSLAPAGPAASDIGPGGRGLMYPGGGRTVFHDGGLSTQGGVAAGWAFDAASIVGPDTAARVAQALGLTGEVQEDSGAFGVGARDGTVPSVWIQPDGFAWLSYSDPAGWAAQGDAPTADSAVKQVSELLAAVGVDVSSLEFESQVSEPEGSADAETSTVAVTAHLVVEGNRTEVSWWSQVGPSGVVSLEGPLAALVGLGQYSVVSPSEAVSRLGDARFGADVFAVQPLLRQDEPAVDPAAPQSSDAVVPTTPPALPGAGSAFSWPITQVTITAAQLTLSQVTQSDGAVVLMPTYQLTGDDGSSWSVIAVTEESLDFTESSDTP